MSSKASMKYAAKLADQGYCRISNKKHIVSRIDNEEWVFLFAKERGLSLHEMFQEVLKNPGHYEDLYRREYSEDRLEISKRAAAFMPGSSGNVTGYVE